MGYFAACIEPPKSARRIFLFLTHVARFQVSDAPRVDAPGAKFREKMGIDDFAHRFVALPSIENVYSTCFLQKIPAGNEKASRPDNAIVSNRLASVFGNMAVANHGRTKAGLSVKSFFVIRSAAISRCLRQQ